MSKNTPVLLAEDDPNDSFLLQHAFESVGIQNPLVVARDGQEAMEYLSGVPHEHPLPCLVLLDLKMPRKNGFDVLEWLQRQGPLKSLPVIVLSSSGGDGDRTRALALGARDYLVKPPDFQALVEHATKLQRSWLASHRGSSESEAEAAA